MPATEIYMVTSAVGMLGVGGGLVIGYYRAVSVLSRQFISKDDCDKCGVRKDVEEAARDLRKGRETFERIKVDLAIIKTKLGIKNDIEELQKALRALENQQSGAST